MQSVIVTQTFDRQAKDAGLTDNEVTSSVDWIAVNALSGDLIAGAGGARKIRFAGKGKGKSGGYRTIHYFGGDDVPVFLLMLIDKGERANISMADRNYLAKRLPELADEYRKSVSERVAPKRRP